MSGYRRYYAGIDIGAIESNVEAVREKIPDNVKIGRNTAISGVTATEDYPGGILESGQIIKAKDGEQA